jgi:rSAM/selenodomain-associated transferase 2
VISVIVPVLDEERLLPAFLADTLPRVEACGGELIVVDGGSRDRTAEIASGHDGLRLLECERGRGRQMNRGASVARHPLLLFLPVDTRLEPGAFRHLARIAGSGSPAAGGFRQRFDCPRRFLRLISLLHTLRSSLTGVFYGDQAPFVRRELFHDVGGFREEIDMEDVELGSRLRRRTRPKLQGFTATTSSRRFDRAGDLRATAEAARLLAGWTFRRRIGKSRTFFESVR